MSEYWREEVADAGMEFEKALDAAKKVGVSWLGAIALAPEADDQPRLKDAAIRLLQEQATLQSAVPGITDELIGPDETE